MTLASISYDDFYKELEERIEKANKTVMSSSMSADEKQLTFKILVKIQAHLQDTLKIMDPELCKSEINECNSLLSEVEAAIIETIGENN